MKKLFTLIACMTLVLHLACTSNDAKDDTSADGSVTESAEGTDAELTSAEAEANATPTETVAEATNDGFLDEQLPEDALGEKTVVNNETPADPMAETQPPPTTIEEPKPEAVIADSGMPPATETPAPTEPPVDTMASVDTGGAASTPAENAESGITSPDAAVASLGMGTTDTAEVKPKASLKKVESMPFKRNGVLLNAVYVARPKDSYKSISKMIYGSNSKAKELKKVNSSMSTPKAGNKIYYNSPTRPTDDQRMQTFYEDSGMSPEVYVAKEGDDLRKIAKELLGYDKAWQEIWATNSVESKGQLTAGTELKYWKSAPIAAAPPQEMPPVAMNNELPQEMPLPPPQEMPAAAQVAVNEMPPPPPMPEVPLPQAAAPMPDLPPPPPIEASPPPPPPMAKKPTKDVLGEPEGMDNDLMMSLAGAGIFAAGIAAIIIVRKRKQQKEMSSAFNDTQVGT